MDEPIEALLVEVRASTQGFRSDMEAMRRTFDTTLVGGFAQAGNVLERGLLGAIRRGTLGFEDLKRTALQTLDQIAAHNVQTGIRTLGGGAGGGIGGLLSGALGALFGLPGRATGGPVSPGQGYLVGERGPEVFVPTTSGRVETGSLANAPRDVRVSIQLAPPKGTAAPVALQRSARQVASSVSRALREF